jgi:hypothetical protein
MASNLRLLAALLSKSPAKPSCNLDRAYCELEARS